MRRSFGQCKKYGNRITYVDGIKFHSKKEAEHYVVLKDRLAKGEIENLELQKAYKVSINGKWLFTWKADFDYDEDGIHRTIDVKPLNKKTGKFITTQIYNLKKKIIKTVLGVTIEET